jgi:hypothetical protein
LPAGSRRRVPSATAKGAGTAAAPGEKPTRPRKIRKRFGFGPGIATAEAAPGARTSGSARAAHGPGHRPGAGRGRAPSELSRSGAGFWAVFVKIAEFI